MCRVATWMQMDSIAHSQYSHKKDLTMTTAKIENLIDLLNAKGGSAYFGEPVSFLNTVCRQPTPPNSPARTRL